VRGRDHRGCLAKAEDVVPKGSGREPQPSDFTGQSSTIDEWVLEDVTRLFASIGALRRARLAALALSGTQLLWIDDHPENNIWERAMFRAFGVECRQATSTPEGLSVLGTESFDVVISDIERHGVADEGIRALPALRERGRGTPIVFYTGSVRRDLPLPIGPLESLTGRTTCCTFCSTLLSVRDCETAGLTWHAADGAMDAARRG